mgnify:CR=1 FL=1
MHQQLSVIQLLSCLNVIVPGQVVDQVRTHGCMGSHKKIEQICDEPGAPVTEIHHFPLWHQATIFLLALACFASEWFLRRRKGLP